MTTITAHATARGSKHWDDRDDATIREMFREGYSDDVIANALGRTVKAVELRRIRLDLRHVDRPKGSVGSSEPKPLSSGQLAEIQRHMDSGLDATAIAALMALPERAVQQAINNHHMIAMPPRNVYRPSSVRTVQPEPAAEPFTHRRLHPDAPTSLPVVEPERTQHADAPQNDVKGPPRVETAENEPTHCTPTYPHLSVVGNYRLDTTDALADWEPYVRAHAQITGMVVVLRRGGKLAISQDAWRAIGAPERVTLLYSRRRNSIGIRPSSDPNQPKVQRDGRMGEINAVGFARQFSLAFEGQRVIATVEQGTLVVEVGV